MSAAGGWPMSNEQSEMKRPYLLATKLNIPRSHTDLIARPHLIGQLDSCLDCQLTLVSAPAGFGKTTLVAEWIKQVKGESNRFAWFSLDQTDNDLAQFLTYFIAGLQKVDASIGETALDWLQAATESPAEAVLAEAINDIVGLPLAVTFVFDDFHLITEPTIHKAFGFLLENQPGNLHLIMISRADPPWPLARLRARRQLHEIRARDLRFSVMETTTFLNEMMQLDLTPEEIAALENRTEGWIAGLQMAALSMRGGNDTAGFVKAFTGSHRFILDYLIEEVLDRQPPDIQDFLLKTSVLERMNAPLCDAVLKRRDSQSVLVQLETENLFLIALDDERRWYRYHHLFADLLYGRLGQRLPDQVAPLHRQASEWYEKNGLLKEAVRHAFLSGDFDQVAHLIGENALAMAYHGELKALVCWLEELPAETVQAKPQLCIAHAWVLGFSGRLQDGEAWLQKAEQALSFDSSSPDGPYPDDKIKQLTSQISAARAYIHCFNDDKSQVANMAREALGGMPQKDLMMRGFTASILAVGLRMIGDYRGSAQAFDEAVTLSQVAGDSHLLVDVLWERSLLEFARGQLNKVMETCQTARQIAADYTSQSGRRLPILGYIYERMSAVVCEWNDLELAERYAREGVLLCQRWGNADALVNSNFCLARALLAKGELDSALDVIQSVEHLVPNLGSWYILMYKTIEAQVRLAQGDKTAVAHWVAGARLSLEKKVNLEYSFMYLAMARFLIFQNKPHEALGLLSLMLEAAEASEGMGLVIRILACQAAALHVAGERASSLVTLERALSLAEPEGFVRTFVDEGRPMRALLEQVMTRGSGRAYTSRLLAAFSDDGEGEIRVTAVAPPPALIEPLSQRELDVLRLLNTHLSATEIAAELFIAPSTVRSHIKNIYSKLNVHGRTEAVVRAEELNLL